MFHHRPTEGPPIAPPLAADKRIYAIGDIHGCHDLLIDLLSQIAEDGSQRADGRRTQIVFLGDYIDRGDNSRDVLDTCLRLAGSGNENLIFLRGNHETAMLEFLDDPVAGRRWLGFGAVQTLASYGLTKPEATDPESLARLRDALSDAMGPHVAFLRALPLSYRSRKVVFCHAGVNPRMPVERDDPQAMLWGHPEFLAADPIPGQLVVHGHFDGAEPVALQGRICVDTGAYHTGRLTAVRLDRELGFLTAPRESAP